MKIIGLTGGIGSGKSMASAYLKKLGFTVIDADKIAREIVEPDRQDSVLSQLEEAFGKSIFFDDGTLNRKKLADIVFSEEKNRQMLDEIMLSRIVQIIRERVSIYKKNENKHIFIDAPLLFEANLDKDCDEVWVVDAPRELRLERVMLRDNVTKEHVEARIKSQISSEEKNKRATYVIDNSSTPEALQNKLQELLKD